MNRREIRRRTSSRPQCRVSIAGTACPLADSTLQIDGVVVCQHQERPSGMKLKYWRKRMGVELLNFRQTLCETLKEALGTHQMSSLRSLAFILASAIRRARALSCAALDRSPDRNSGRKTATKMATKMDAKSQQKCRSLPCQSPANSILLLGLHGTLRRCSVQEYNQPRFRPYP
jgi:hypothetical protein